MEQEGSVTEATEPESSNLSATMRLEIRTFPDRVVFCNPVIMYSPEDEK